jgi:tRNA nucleotidyltransferase (CCA-adding enzyme)
MTSTLSSGARQPLSKELREFLRPLLEKARATRLPVYLVGGCVRDLMLKKPSLDIDLVVEGPADLFVRAAAKSYKAKVVSHPQFLTHTLRLPKGRHLDIATARTETYPEPATLPVVEPASLQEDLYRRDFSINAMALSLNDGDFGHLWDPFGGAEDLAARRIRVLHADSFKDDPTRIFRAARFGARFGAELEWRTREWLSECLQQQLPAKLSGARLREELVCLITEKDPRPAFRMLAEWNALEFLVANVHWDKSHEALLGHVLKADARLDSLLLRVMALMHLVPLPKAVGVLSHLMFPQSLVSQVEQALQLLSQLREGNLSPKMKARAQRPLSGEIKFFIEQALRVKGLLPFKKPLEQWQRFEDSAPCLSGRDLRDLGYKPGPKFKQMFDAVREARWQGKLRTREEEIQFLLRTFPVAKAS